MVDDIPNKGKNLNAIDIFYRSLRISLQIHIRLLTSIETKVQMEYERINHSQYENTFHQMHVSASDFYV